MTRLALALVVVAAGVGTVVHRQHHHRPPTSAQSDVLASALPLRASRAQEERQPLPGRQTPFGIVPEQGATPAHRRAPVRRIGPSRPAPGSGLSDVTMYCATGNRNADGRWPQLGDVAVLDRSIPFGTRVLIEGRSYVVRDWIGHGSDFDIYGGSDAGCEQRALNFGRRHERVEVAS